MHRGRDVVEILKSHGIQPSAQRVAVAEVVLFTDEHPSADQVLAKASKNLRVLSRATVYNTLHLFVEKGLLRELVLAEGRSVYDPKLEKHHHFVDADSGRILDIPWDAVDVGKVEQLEGFEIDEYQVVMRGRRTPAAS